MKITVGSTVPLEISVIDESGNAEDIADVTRAVFTMKDAVADSVAVLQLDTDAGDLSLSALAQGKLIGNITQGQSDALVPGMYIAECNLFFATPTDWTPTARFRVEVEIATAPTLP